VPSLPDFKIQSPLPSLEGWHADTTVRELIVHGEKRWDVGKVMDLFSEEEYKKIISIPLRRNGEDALIWPEEDNDSKQAETLLMEAIRWEPPEKGWIKCNSDGAFDQNSNEAGYGVVIRDEKGRLLDGTCNNCVASSALQAEAIALEQALSLVVQKQMDRVSFEVDSSVLYNVVTQPKKSKRWCIDPIITKISDKMKWVGSCNLMLTKREANEAANWVATNAKKKKVPSNWIQIPPSSLVFILDENGLPAPPSVSV
ncbi:hypothetical protein CCACVL1_09458, partial [Corchorus capsularis]